MLQDLCLLRQLKKGVDNYLNLISCLLAWFGGVYLEEFPIDTFIDKSPHLVSLISYVPMTSMGQMV